MKTKGIVAELCAPYSPESNGKAERLNRTLVDIAKTMLLDVKGLEGHQKLWAEAVKSANYLRNRMYSSACNDVRKAPFEVIIKKKPEMGHIRRFGCKPFVHQPKEKRNSKVDARASTGVLTGFERGNSYKIYLPNIKKFIISRDVSFHETPKDWNEL